MKYTHSIGLLTKFKNGNENRIVYFKETNPDYANTLIEINKDFAAAISILNGEIRESYGEFCICAIPSIYLNTSQSVVCANCGKVYVQNYQERT
jgi:hypothetical protein